MDARLDFIFGRRSIRAYTTEPVSPEAIEAMLHAAMSAPSAVAKDPWRFIVVQHPETLARIAGALPHGKMIAGAPLGIVVCGDLRAAHDQQLSYLLQDCSAAIENLLLAAHLLGLGACWLGVHPRENRVQDLRALFQLPAHILPVAAIAIGHPAEIKEPRSRYCRDYVHHEQWSGP